MRPVQKHIVFFFIKIHTRKEIIKPSKYKKSWRLSRKVILFLSAYLFVNFFLKIFYKIHVHRDKTAFSSRNGHVEDGLDSSGSLSNSSSNPESLLIMSAALGKDGILRKDTYLGEGPSFSASSSLPSLADVTSDCPSLSLSGWIFKALKSDKDSPPGEAGIGLSVSVWLSNQYVVIVPLPCNMTWRNYETLSP